ncbi:MAG: adenylate/guanylate cyclase domain-containing protein [Pseudomonadota bacterium]|nr:MAG: adenylate/guanylate cyclase domain-containing protein [Pseudomonadota bacterium]
MLALTPFHVPLETNVGLYALFHVRGERPPPAEVAIVAVDGRTGEKLDLPPLFRDWPRSVHGKLVEELSRRGATAIVFDMDFRRSRSEQEDLAFGRAVAKANRVVLFEHLTGRLQPVEDAQGRMRGAVWAEQAEPPVPALAGAARALGPFPLPKMGAAVHQFWTFKASAREAPTMPAVALQVHSLAHYEQWRTLLAASTRVPLDKLPMSAADVRDAQQMRALMRDTRSLIAQQDPELAERIAAKLAAVPVEESSHRISKALLGLYAGEGERYLNYYGPPGTIRTLPYHAVIKGSDPNLSPSALDVAGKTVFVGYSDLFDPGQPDRFFTVFTRNDGVDLSGVEIAATAFANLLTESSLKPLGATQTSLTLLVFGMVVGALVYLTPAAIGVVLALGLATAYAIGAQLSFNNDGLWWPLATPLLVQLPLALFIGLFAQYRLERRRVQHISDAIRHYVPESVSRVLTAPGGAARDVNKVTYGTCLATDMAGFSTIAEKMSPGDLANFLNEYFEVLAQALKRHGVEVTEFRADAIMCAWTGSVDDPAVRQRPVLAALEAAQAIGLFNSQRNLSGSLRIGLADGEFYVGHAGGGGHFVFSIVGDCANTASRIENLNKHLGSRILATGTVVNGQNELLARHLGKYRFVGKTEALPISEILSTKAGAMASQIDLCEQFATAFTAFEQGDWAQAVERFEDLLRGFPQDGPTRFLLERCRANLRPGATPDAPGIIAMTAK